MTARSAFGLLGLAGGILGAVRWWRERPERARPVADPQRVAGGRFGTAAEDRSARRRQAMRLAYAVGSAASGAGVAGESAGLLAAGVVLLNLGTLYRYLLVALDHRTLAEPLPGRPAGGLLGEAPEGLEGSLA